MAHFITQRCANDALPGEQLIYCGWSVATPAEIDSQDNQIHQHRPRNAGHADPL